MIKEIFKWIFSSELKELNKNIDEAKSVLSKVEIQEKRLDRVLNGLDVSVDVNYRSSSWAVISLQGQRTNYIKFIDLKDSNLSEIATYLRRFERNTNIKIDADPVASRFLRIDKD